MAIGASINSHSGLAILLFLLFLLLFQNLLGCAVGTLTLQDQLNYINHIFKPRHTKPSVFKNQLLRLNNQILLIPEAEETDKFDDSRIKSIYFSAMPSHWKKEFRKHGNKLSTQSIDELAQYFDIYHNDSTNTRHTHSHSNNNNNNNNNNQRNNKHYNNNDSKSTTPQRPKPDDICPIHGGHKWHFCIFNKDGPNYRPPARNATTTTSARSNENFNTEQLNETNDDNSTSIAPYDDEFNSADPSNEPVPQIITEATSPASDTVFTFANCLLDSGGTRSLIPLSRLPNSIPRHKSIQPYSALSSSGVHQHHEYITLSKIRFPQFSTNIWLENVEFIIFDDSEHCAYDIILGRNIIKQFGFIINFAKNETSCLNVTLPFLHRNTKPCTEPAIIQNFINDTPTATSTNIHKQREQLNSIPSEFPKLFANDIGKSKHYVKLQLIDPNTTPIHSKPFTIPNVHRQHFNNIITELVANNVLRKIISSKWAFPSFLVPKKNGTFRLVSDFRRLNKLLADAPYPLPQIKDVLQRRASFTFVSVIDITSQFYHFNLDNASRSLCVITTPFGLFQYLRLPMGIKIAPSFAQSVMDSLFGHVNYVEVFMDDIAVFSTSSFAAHLITLRSILSVLESENFRINISKCTFAVTQVDYLGHTITQSGIKPQIRKISTVLNLEEPTNVKQLRSFIGLVNYYRDFIPQRSHILTPLTTLTSPKLPFLWSTTCRKAFKRLKMALSASTLLAFPNPRLPFIIEPDASDYQLGSIISQHPSLSSTENIIKTFLKNSSSTIPAGFHPIAFFSRKLSPSQRNYTTLEKELLSIVETLVEYRTILYGNKILTFTDHRNLTFDKLSSQRALRWRLLAEEFNITIIFRKGATNLAADAISRLPLQHTEQPLAIKELESKFYDSYFNNPIQSIIGPSFPLHFSTIHKYQQNDPSIQHLPTSSPSQFQLFSVHDIKLLHYR